MSMLRSKPLLVMWGKPRRMLVLINMLWGKPFFPISHFLFFFYLRYFFTLPLHQVPLSSAGDTTDVVGEVVVEAEKYPAAEQQVQHLSHFYLSQSFFMISISVIFYDFSLSYLEAVMVTLQLNPVHQGTILFQLLKMLYVA
jgi:hypothetical protein